VKRRTGDPPVLVASSRRARLALGWHPEHSKLEQMLADAWAWRLTHPNGYSKGPRTDGAVTLDRQQPDVRPDRQIPRPGAPASA
jgi:UDP-glucose 4-epimerase